MYLTMHNLLPIAKILRSVAVVVLIVTCSRVLFQSSLNVNAQDNSTRVPICGEVNTAGGDTPTGDCLTDFISDFNAIKTKPNVEAMLLFSPFGDNPDPHFVKHLVPPSVIQQLCGGGSCIGTKVGVNPANYFGQGGTGHPATYGFDWFLQIAKKDDVAGTIATINALPAHTKAIIRIGVTSNGGGFSGEPQAYIDFLKKVYAKLSDEKKTTTYAIAGPNEPDIEWDWFAPECNQGLTKAFYDCIGPKLASYMNAVIDGGTGLQLLSPAFNLTSFSLGADVTKPGIFASMDAAGARWAGLAGIAGNLYPNTVPMTTHWQTNNIDALLTTAGKPLIITETGPFGCALTDATPTCINPDKYYIQPVNGVNGTTPTRLTTENPDKSQMSTIRDELIMQGYEARCAAPMMKITLTEAGRGAMERLWIQPPSPGSGFKGVILGMNGSSGLNRIDTTGAIYSRLDVDYRDILVPLLRDLDRSDPTLKRSIEDYFGFKEANDGVYTSAELKTSAINSLLSNEQRCTVAYQNLLAQETMCQKLADPNQCALYETRIPKTTFTVRSLFQAFEAARGEQSANDYCRTLMGATTATDDQLRVGMANAPLTIEKAYRLAFMVTSVGLWLPGPKILNLYTHPYGGWLSPPKPNHAAIIVAFKIPDILTNKGFNDGYTIDTGYDDSATLTKDSLITRAEQEKIEIEARRRRRLLLERARELTIVPQHTSWAEITCMGGTGVTGVSGPQCKDPLTKAVVELINTQAVLERELEPAPQPGGPQTALEAEANEGRMVNTSNAQSLEDLLGDEARMGEDYRAGWLECDDQYETGRTINDPGSINAPSDPSHVFKENLGAALLANLFGDCSHDGEGDGHPSFASTQDPSTDACTGENWFLKSKYYVINPKDPPEQFLGTNDPQDYLPIKQYIVYPTGYELRTVEAVLAGSFFTKKQLADVLTQQQKAPSATQKLVDQFQLENSKLSFNGGEGGYSYTDYCNENSTSDFCARPCPTVTKFRLNRFGQMEEYEEEVCPTRSFSYGLVVSAPKAASILGAKLGYWMRKIQLTLNATTQASYSYLKKCASLEEFLLDQCGGEPRKAAAKPVSGAQAVSYCKSNDITITNKDTTRFALLAGSGPNYVDVNSDFYFLDNTSKYTLKLASRIVDGATLVVTGGVVTMNPGQNYTDDGISQSRCGSTDENQSTKMLIWYLPEQPPEGVDAGKYWEDNATRFVPTTGTSDWTNMVANLRVKPGFYSIREGRRYCLSENTVRYDISGAWTENSVIEIGEGPQAKDSYCAKVTMSSNMPGGPDGGVNVFMKQSFSCTIPDPGYDIMLNTDCGGLGGSGELKLWQEYLRDGKLLGLDIYEKIFGRKFTLPNENASCSELFPNTIQEVGCNQATNADVEASSDVTDPPGGDWVGDTCTSSTTLEEIKYYERSQLPVTGAATYYGLGVFNQTLNTRLSGAAGNDFKGNTTVKNCELDGVTFADAQAAAVRTGQKFVGCVALLREGDLEFRTAWNQGRANPNSVRPVWLKNTQGAVHGPFAVIDVAQERHAPCLYDQGWAVDIDYNSFRRLFNQTAGPDRATVCDSASC